MLQTLRNRFGSELTVVLEEDYGYRSWIWYPEMTLSQLIDWWSSQDHITRFIGPDLPYGLPGDLYSVETEEEDYLWASGYKRSDCCKAWLGADFDSCLITTNGDLIVDKGFPPEQLEFLRKRLSAYLA